MNNQNRTVIVAGVDATVTNQAVVMAAGEIANSYANAELHLVHVLNYVKQIKMVSGLDGARELLESMVKLAGSKPVTLHVATGQPWREVVQVAADLHADMVVVGTHDMSRVERALLGSVAEQVVRHAHCPVYVVRPKNWVDNAPEIEPACPDCLRAQADTLGDKLWCERHSIRHIHGKLHYASPQGFGGGSMFNH